ncbi:MULTISPECIES: EthD domain-containing protein [Pasteurellaceae]|uniref:EthD domain-containing protein n=1 Tax=Pasteurellaceae TaxID=712 RepID=UPI0035669C7E
MFKVIMLVKKKDSLTQEEFVALWQAHSQKVMTFKSALQIQYYSKTFPLSATHSPSTQRETEPFVYDAMGELWYESKAAFIQARNSPAGRQALAILKEDERQFVDLARSVMWLGEEEPVLSWY